MASSTAGIQVQGARELRKTMKAAGEDLGDLKDAHARAGAIAGTRARSDAPRVTGTLGASVRWSGAAGSATIRAGSASVPYAGPIHFGWRARGIAPQPFITEAAQATEPEWTAEYQEAVEKILARIRGVGA